MASSTVKAKPTIVLVILLVTGIASIQQTLIDSALVTILAIYPGMCTFQLEDRKVVVECGWRPTGYRMASAAFHTKA